MEAFVFVVFAGAITIGVNVLGYQMLQSAARDEIEAWAKEKGYRLLDLKPGSCLSYLIRYVSFDVTYENASGMREEVVAGYSRSSLGLMNSLSINPKDTFDYNKY